MPETDEGFGFRLCCKCCRIIVISGLAALFLWLALRTSEPTCFINDFYVPLLNKSDHSTDVKSNNSIFFGLKLDNEMKEKGVYYDNISLTFYYNSNTGLPIANYTVPGFRQGYGKKARLNLVVQADGPPWEAAIRSASNEISFSIFTVRLSTKVRYRIIFWKTRRHSLVVGASVPVNGSGKNANKKGVKLKSDSPEPGCSLVPLLFSSFLVVLL